MGARTGPRPDRLVVTPSPTARAMATHSWAQPPPAAARAAAGDAPALDERARLRARPGRRRGDLVPVAGRGPARRRAGRTHGLRPAVLLVAHVGRGVSRR